MDQITNEERKTVAKLVETNKEIFGKDPPSLEKFAIGWNIFTSKFITHGIFTPLMQMLAYVTLMQAYPTFARLIMDNGTEACLLLTANELYNLALTLYDVHLESQNAVANLLDMKCTTAKNDDVKKFVDDYHNKRSLVHSLLGAALPDVFHKVLLLRGSPVVLRKAIVSNPAVRTYEQTRNQLLLSAGPMARGVELMTPPANTNSLASGGNAPMILNNAEHVSRRRDKLTQAERDHRMAH